MSALSCSNVIGYTLLGMRNAVCTRPGFISLYCAEAQSSWGQGWVIGCSCLCLLARCTSALAASLRQRTTSTWLLFCTCGCPLQRMFRRFCAAPLCLPAQRILSPRCVCLCHDLSTLSIHSFCVRLDLRFPPSPHMQHPQHLLVTCCTLYQCINASLTCLASLHHHDRTLDSLHLFSGVHCVLLGQRCAPCYLVLQQAGTGDYASGLGPGIWHLVS